MAGKPRPGKTWNEDRVTKEFESALHLNGYKYEFIEQILYADSKIKVICQNSHEYVTELKNIFGKKKPICSVCSRGIRWSAERLRNEFKEFELSGWKLVDSPSHLVERSCILIECDKGHRWTPKISNFFRHRTGCPACRMSKGEKEIALILKRDNINFISEKKFEECRRHYPLRFDFYLPDYNILIEYQGKQHYELATFTKDKVVAEYQFEQIKIRDAIKKQWAIDNGYRFLEIPYTAINQIEEILTQELCI